MDGRSTTLPRAKRLGVNRGRYCGETIDVRKFLADFHHAALEAGWETERLGSAGGLDVCAYRRPVSRPEVQLYLSSGIHGDEPAGPVALLQSIRENRWPDGVEIRVCPCLNPTGFQLNQRENASGVDLNRDYRHLRTAEVRAHVDWLRRQPRFDLSLILHEDWEASGFYLYELGDACERPLADDIVRAVEKVFPIEPGESVDGWRVERGVIRPRVRPEDRPDWPEAVFLVHEKTPRSYTLETPSDYELPARARALTIGVRAALRSLEDRGV